MLVSCDGIKETCRCVCVYVYIQIRRTLMSLCLECFSFTSLCWFITESLLCHTVPPPQVVGDIEYQVI